MDSYTSVPELKAAEQITFTNAKGAYAYPIAEYIIGGMMYHYKKMESFMEKKVKKEWQ